MRLVVEQRAAERALGALGAGHVELLVRELRAPLGVGLLHPRQVERADELALGLNTFTETLDMTSL